MSDYLHIERVFNADFLQWISGPNLSNDFECLQTYLNAGYPDAPDLIPAFLTGSMPKLYTSPPKDRNTEIPRFYFFKSKPKYPTPFNELYSPNHKIDKITLAKIFYERYKIPNFFAAPFLYQSNPRAMRPNHEYIRFSSLIPIGEKLDTKSFQEQIFELIIYGRKRDYAVADDFGFYIVRYLQCNKKFEPYIKNTSECSIFSRYILMNLVIIYDPEFRGRITRNQFIQYDFLQILEDVADFEKFQEIFKIFDSLDIQRKNSLSFKELVLYDHKRIHPKVLERVWKFLPGTKVNDRITFADFVVYIILLEIKESQAALNFWFRVCDIEEDGILSLNEMNFWYKLQKQMLKIMNTETEKFKQLVPQIMDMMGSNATQWTRSQIKDSGAWPRLYNILIDPKLFYGYFELREDMAISHEY
ncbi:hypothetical protein TRFO_22572 [Tritrichomonas foetus]|uniref:EF-hand domain-containing protein n=1 Tax=Tritrichomonas foetus TaxID=1144522 RepID=A0A1J4KGM7_9EUKA|nr:hypothetical protein TRFO_22572 [Tritrichomonas foetus]|eukprot:OHT08814.1 hypothetical protein TRFO_22572 [Tritrichomonas foetus]